MRSLYLASAVVVVATVAACGGGHRPTTVMIPPVLDLQQYGAAAALTGFTAENAKGTLHEMATRRFSERVLGASRAVEILELGDAAPLLKASGETTFGPATAMLVGTTRNVPVVFAGHLKVSNVKPSGGITGFGIPHLEATVSVDLTVALYSTKSGGTLWRSGANASEKVGSLAVVGGEPSFSAKDPNAAYGRLVDRLVAVVTRDLYPTYERR